jgi:hypothetical protein
MSLPPLNNIFQQEVLPDLIERRQNIIDGNINAIPFSFSKLSSYVYGIEHSRQYGVTGPSGSSKSKLGRDMFLFQPFQYYYNNKDISSTDVRFNLFCLEDSKKKVTYNLLSKALWDKYRIRIPVKKLESATNEALDEKIINMSNTLIDYFDDFFSKVYMSNTSNPTGIKKEIEGFLTHPSVGSYYTANGKKLDNQVKSYDIQVKTKNGTETRKGTELQAAIQKGEQVRYEKNNKNLFVINIIDNLQVISEESGQTKYKTLDDFTRKLMRNRLCEFFGCANVLVQQQNQAMRSRKIDSFGEVVSDTLIPSIAGLGEFKNSVQTMHYLFGIYSPFNDALEKFNKYDIKKLAYYYRHIYILKSNYTANVNFPTFADPIAETFEDLPAFNDTAGLDLIYQRISKLEGIEKKSNTKLL